MTFDPAAELCVTPVLIRPCCSALVDLAVFSPPGERPFSCQHCKRAFADRSNLRAHLQTHSQVKKYRCRSCSRTFSRMSLLQKHNVSRCCPV